MARTMKDSGIEWIGQIPDNWHTDRLQWHLEEINVSNKPIQTEKILSLTIEAGVIPYEDKGNQGNKSKENLEEYKLAYPDTLVVNSMNIIIGAVGISNYYGCVSPVYYVFKATEDSDLRYIYYLFTNVGFQKEMRKYAKGILEIRLRISASDMLKLKIPKLCLDEQQKIANFLDSKCASIDAIIEKTKASIEEYKKLKQAIITQAVTKGIRGKRSMKDSGIEWIGKIPEKWGIPKIKYMAQIASGSTPDRNRPEYWNGTIRWIKTGELQNNVITDSEEYITELALKETSVSLFAEDTILIAMYGQGKTRGMTALLAAPCTTNQACAGLTITSKNITVSYLWKCVVGAYNGIREIAQGTGQPNLNAKLISDFHIPLPPIEEQEEIVSFLEKKIPEINMLITKKEIILTEMEYYKKSLIYEYVTGKKEVPNCY